MNFIKLKMCFAILFLCSPARVGPCNNFVYSASVGRMFP